LSLVDSGENKYFDFEISDLANFSTTVLHPDSTHKSEGKQIWSGSTFAEITSKFKNQISKYPNTIIIGSDTYLAKLPTTDLLAEKVLFANKKGNKLIPEKKGGVHTIFTQSSEKKYHEDSSFWVWNVQGITLGELVPTLKIKDEKNAFTTIDTRKFRKIILENYTFTYPPGRRNEKEIPKKVKNIEAIELADLIETKGINKIVISNLFGKIESVKDEIKNLVAITGVDRQPISRSLGGPIQICDRNNNKKCLYFADSIEVSKQ